MVFLLNTEALNALKMFESTTVFSTALPRHRKQSGLHCAALSMAASLQRKYISYSCKGAQHKTVCIVQRRNQHQSKVE